MFLKVPEGFQRKKFCADTLLLPSVLNVKGLVGALNQEKALVGAFSMIVKSSRTSWLKAPTRVNPR